MKANAMYAQNVENHLLNYQEINEPCQFCQGTGKQRIDKDELEAKLFDLWNKGYRYDILITVYRIWKMNPFLDCSECNGHGEIRITK